MKFSVGDKMVIRRSGEEGYIVSIIDKQMAEVSVNGTVFPIYLDEIDHPYLRWFTQKNQAEKKRKLREQIPVEPMKERPRRTPSGIHFTFLPEFATVEMEERVQRLKLYIANDTAHKISIDYQVRLRSEVVFSYRGSVPGFTDLYLHYLSWEEMQEQPRFEWTVRAEDSPGMAAHTETIKIRPLKLFGYINDLLANNHPSFRHTLLTEFRPEAPKALVAAAPGPVPRIPQAVHAMAEIPRYEVDLHIEQLVADQRGLSNAEKLSIQLAELERYLRLAERNRQDKMIIIHGLGKGILRQEVHKVLRTKSFVEHIESGWQAGYGFGATLVYFRYP